MCRKICKKNASESQTGAPPTAHDTDRVAQQWVLSWTAIGRSAYLGQTPGLGDIWKHGAQACISSIREHCSPVRLATTRRLIQGTGEMSRGDVLQP